ncbi:type I-U CRISPR-associated RAMP protein Csb1/Cas7u [uncultured Desulfuromonas sp.]|uniref:type I-G CRISPR-associated RAMP protein Csb1/Cas7g n=1 Tax=uncultured Desulfuromonas sp. TaxID=181013 RepID=UPI002AAAC0C6|nr:type I-U CRISPR-associated RAMP protein Csb1/Cas7u [uncultured Desulfuromonas sp.]
MADVAISIKSTLENVTGSKHIYPATFANSGHNYVGYDKTTGKAEAVLVDSVGSFANRIEGELAATGLLPRIAVQVAGRTLSIHELPHRVYDAILRDSELDGQPWRSSTTGEKILASNIDNATALFQYAPLTLLLGGWDSYGGDVFHGAKLARVVSGEIWGRGVSPNFSPINRIRLYFVA